MAEDKRLENRPLKFVLAEFRFSPVLNIAKHVPKIQEALRGTYPILKKGIEPSLVKQPGYMSVTDLDRWEFISADRNRVVVLTQQRLVYVTSANPRFVDFSDACGTAVDALVDIVQPRLILRIGLRYGDLVTVDNGEEITALVDEQFVLNNSTESFGRTDYYQTESGWDTDSGFLLLKTLYGNLDLAYLPDVQELPVYISAGNAPSERIILDFDHIWEAESEPVRFKTKDAIKKLNALQEAPREAFWKVTTEYARNEKWV